MQLQFHTQLNYIYFNNISCCRVSLQRHNGVFFQQIILTKGERNQICELYCHYLHDE